MHASMTASFILMLCLVVRTGHCIKQCVSLSTSTDKLYVQSGGEATIYVTLNQLCDAGSLSLESLSLAVERNVSFRSPVCLLLIDENGACSPENMCSCEPSRGRFKVSGKLSHQEREVWVITGTVRGVTPSYLITKVIVLLNATTVQDVSVASESTTEYLYSSTSTVVKDSPVTANDSPMLVLVVLSSASGALFLASIVVMCLLYGHVMRKIKEGKLTVLKLKQEYASSPSISSHTPSKEDALYALAKERGDYSSDGNDYQDLPPAYVFYPSSGEDLTLNRGSGADLTISLRSTASSVKDKQQLEMSSTDSEEYWRDQGHGATSSESTDLGITGTRAYALPHVSCSSLTVCSV